jgi:prepilin peptidase CpaA
MWVTTLADHSIAPIQWGAVLGATLVGALIDSRSHRLPNALTGPLYLAGLAFAVWVGGLAGLVDGFAASLVLGLPYVILFAVGGGGAGDAKMMAAVGAWLGLTQGVVCLVSVAVVGGLVGIGTSLVRSEGLVVLGHLRGITASYAGYVLGHRGWKDTQELVPQPSAMRAMPYGVSIFIGACVAALATYLWRA